MSSSTTERQETLLSKGPAAEVVEQASKSNSVRRKDAQIRTQKCEEGPQMFEKKKKKVLRNYWEVTLMEMKSIANKCSNKEIQCRRPIPPAGKKSSWMRSPFHGRQTQRNLERRTFY